MSLSTGTDFGSYHLIRPLGQGGFAEVWEAESRTTGRRVALKVLTQFASTSTNSLERFRQEGRLAASLFHPRCVYVFDAGAVNGVPFISMELMPGGTLADALRAGPLSPTQAVDHVLDMLDGLEAAHASGIIHRDLKPSNIFLDAHGRVRIGDFGISKSLDSEVSLTVPGGFLGTPQYASPEQAGGEALDSRSDLYAAGAVLYELLAGQPPHGGENPAQALARVLTQPPAPFPARVVVPRGLQRVVFRLLARDRDKRYASCAAARDALAPYSSHGVSTADLARRLAAVAADFALMSFVGSWLSSLVFGHQLLAQGLNMLGLVAYFTIMEGWGGASIGKRLAALRVVTPAGGAPGWARIAFRSTLFVLLYSGPPTLITNFALSFFPLLVLGTQLLAIAVLVSTMRRDNGFAGLHEVLSGTRVVVLHRRDRTEAVPEDPPQPVAPPDAVPPFGPFRPQGIVWRAGDEAVYVAHDDELRRDVWIHTATGRARALLPPAEELRSRGPGSLPWLQRGESDGVTWDAYGAPQGTLLERWAARRPLGWGMMRRVLGTLAHEIDQRRARRAADAGSLAAERVWVSPPGSAQLLDFSLAAPQAAAASDESDFLRSVATLGLTGTSSPAAAPPAIPLPVRARRLLERLWGTAPASGGMGELSAALDQETARPATITTGWRIATLAIPAVLPALMLLFLLIRPGSRYPPWFQDLVGERPHYLKVLQRPAPAATDTLGLHTAAAIEIALASALNEAQHTARIGEQVLALMPAADRALIDSVARRHPNVPAADADSARAWLAAHRALWAEENGRKTPIAIAVLQLVAFGCVGVGLSLILRGPVLLHLAGLSVVRKDGAPAGRMRCAARSAVGWAPIIALFWVQRLPLAMQLPCAALAAGGIAFSLFQRERGISDRVLGTVLVPK
ncbi:MAG TPA: protein kinase [Gemmatimonadales bacterium]|nr:protein kinase [Gemmatimonadales bacterium]